jgi:hypothetical protein
MTMQSEPQDPTSQSYTVKVTPDDLEGAVFEFTDDQGAVQKPLVICVPYNEKVAILFNLDASSGVWDAIHWYSAPPSEGGTRIEQSTVMTVTGVGSKIGTIENDNSQSDSSGTYHFTCSVLLDGKVYTSPDPTIINNPIG